MGQTLVRFKPLPKEYYSHPAGEAGIATLADGRQFEAVRLADGRVIIPPAARREDIPDQGRGIFNHVPKKGA